MGEKPCDHRAAPLCKEHHQAQHTQGERTFWNAYLAASGKTVDDLLEALCRESPKARDIALAKQERGL